MLKAIRQKTGCEADLAGFAVISAQSDGCEVLSEAGFHILSHTDIIQKPAEFTSQPSKSECINNDKSSKVSLAACFLSYGPAVSTITVTPYFFFPSASAIFSARTFSGSPNKVMNPEAS